jgi:hypothetical protein
MKYLLYTFLFLLSACSTVQVETDYNPGFDFGTLSSYAIVHKEKADDDTLKNGRIIRALRAGLNVRGYVEQDRETADFYVLFHTRVRSRTRIDTDYEFVGLYPYRWYGYYAPMTLRTTRVSSYDEEKLIVDVVVPEGNRIVWRGMATDRTQDFDTPEERIAYINRVIASLLDGFPPQAAPKKR